MDAARDADVCTGSVPVALLLAAVAGLLDAIVYLNHGHVFATAMTGNTVLLGIAALSGDFGQVIHHAAPIVAFVVGAVIARWLGRATAHAYLISLLFEAAALVIAGVLPASFPQVALVLWIAFVSAVQVESFRRIGPFPYSSTYLTGDLRDIAESLHDTFTAAGSDHRAARARLRDLGLVWLCFLAGAALGALAAPVLGEHGFWLPLPLLAMALAAELRRRGRQRAASTPQTTERRTAAPK
jgi:uncharacterized membrane protein YoaK (UPF0700 family)